MAFIETPTFPAKIAIGANVSIRSSVENTPLQNGFELNNLNWSQGLRTFKLSLPFRNTAEMESLRAHYIATGYGAHQFRFQDWTDFNVLQSDGIVGLTGVGTGVQRYKLYKRYVAGTLTEFRRISKPQSGTVIGYRNSSPITIGSGAGNISIDTVTGEMVFVADASGNVNSHTIGVNHIFNLSTSSHGLVNGMKIFITNVTGTAASILNSIAHTVTGVAGAVITTNTNTTGKTASGGNFGRYPQAADALAFAGKFDVPVKYGSELNYRTESQSLFLTDDITIQEIRVS